jgi:hypothetical protein
MAEIDEEGILTCSNPDCRVAETGRCVEGIELNTCPHYGLTSDEYIDEAPEIIEQTSASNSEQLLSGQAWTTTEVSKILCERESRVIAIIGPSEAGKTSLIASLYDLYQLGPIFETEFAGSRTLHAFEYTCHDARAASRRNISHTARTAYGEVKFYHIDLCLRPSKNILALLLADRAGEEYRSAADDASLALMFPEILRADSLTVLVDGNRLLDAGARHNIRHQIKMILQAFVDTKVVQEDHRLALVLTKIDSVYESQHKERAESDFNSLVGSIRQIFGGVFQEIEQFSIAASPKTDIVPRGTGMPELLDFWLRSVRPILKTKSTKPEFRRAFARLESNSD